ncbi:hypothetical protein GNI_105410 [Gregarina niphandrodes]|uniref:Uncharacterized protein n=1 Tax=Gregarina niphandrodes TaxID=110365 RepID=A0A023B438_GRENI|nr:hypothetical protein GNI_105410 [Gregarina niphandrodes]EZG56150.1 hypothetical protein GNI_105410 [Gregarina niphandrodes]|eukprot:XP_011131323.1 hypothetical protein GNI_105410 [Gregarina niphandrodes]
MDPSWLPENRRPHAQDVAFELLDSGCRPAGCCENTSCSKVTVRPDIPEQVASCADELPTGCYYYAKAVANVTGALCHHESLWSSASGVCFDLMGLGGWQAPIYSLWQIHNAYTEGCRHMQFSMHRNVTNVDKAALRSCSLVR